MGEITKGEIGSEGAYDLKLEGGKLVVSVGHNSKGFSLGVQAGVSVDYFMDKLAELIPGKVDDAVIEMLKIALKGV